MRNEMNDYNEKFEYYKDLLSFSYDELLEHLREKHGPVTDDYYRERSYQRFLDNKIKSIQKGKYSRTQEGLYTHHNFENEYENLSNEVYIKTYRYPYELQRKENLVYCDLIEHLILHAKITVETNGEYGYRGYREHILPAVTDWFILGKIPKPQWMQISLQRAYLPQDLARDLLALIDAILWAPN